MIHEVEFLPAWDQTKLAIHWHWMVRDLLGGLEPLLILALDHGEKGDVLLLPKRCVIGGDQEASRRFAGVC